MWGKLTILCICFPANFSSVPFFLLCADISLIKAGGPATPKEPDATRSWRAEEWSPKRTKYTAMQKNRIKPLEARNSGNRSTEKGRIGIRWFWRSVKPFWRPNRIWQATYACESALAVELAGAAARVVAHAASIVTNQLARLPDADPASYESIAHAWLVRLLVSPCVLSRRRVRHSRLTFQRCKVQRAQAPTSILCGVRFHLAQSLDCLWILICESIKSSFHPANYFPTSKQHCCDFRRFYRVIIWSTVALPGNAV